MNDKVAVFGQRRAGVYLLSEIYNPDNVKSSVQNVGTVIPAVGSLVVDDSVTEHNTLYVVYSVDATTFKSTLVPAAIPATADIEDDQIITYGNNIYMLFYESTVVTLDDSTTKTLWKFMVDNKICIFGTSAKSYSIYKGSSIDSTAEIITDFYYENNVLTRSDNGRVPMDQILVPTTSNTGVPALTQAMLPRIAYSETSISQGEFYTFVAFDSSNRAIAQIVIVAHPTLGIASLVYTQHPIESFKVGSNQYDSSDNMHYLLRGQSVNELHFYPDIIWSNGEQNIATQIDNTQLFIYGVEEISTAVVNNVYTVLFKYYLGNLETSQTGKDYSIGETGRYIYTTVKVKIISPYTSKISKLALLTKVSSDKKYSILPVIFYNNRATAPAIVANEDYIASSFQSDLYNTPQILKLRTYEQLSGDVQQSTYNQTYQMTLFNPDTVTDTVLYYFRDEPSSTGNFYGKNIVNMPRPVINYQPEKYTYKVASGTFVSGVDYYTRTGSGTTSDPYVYTKATVVVGQTIPSGYYTLELEKAKCYYIPNTTFTTAQMFLNSFYYKADPPLVDGELTLKDPTHFTIRRLNIGSTPATSDINIVLPSPVKIVNYANNLAFTTELFVDGSYPNTCMVEFLYSEDDTNFEHLYGVPVEIRKADQTEVETGSAYRGDLYFTFMKPDVADVEQYKLTYTGTETNRGFNRSWGYTDTENSISATISYNKSSSSWILTYTNGNTVKTWTVGCTDDYLSVCSLAWNYTGNWIYDNEVTITENKIDTDLLQYASLDIYDNVSGLITKHPTIYNTDYAKYVSESEHGPYLLLNEEGGSSTRYQGYVRSTVHTSWLAWNKDWTIEMWLMLGYDNCAQAIFGSNEDYKFALGQSVEGSLNRFNVMLSNYEATGSASSWLNGEAGYASENDDIVTNTWYHVAIVHTASNHTYTMYLNGMKHLVITPTTETSARPYWYDNYLQIAKWANEEERTAPKLGIHGFRVCRSARYIDIFNPQWDVSKDPIYTAVGTIPTLQLDNEESRYPVPPHYSVELATWTNDIAEDRAVEIYLDGFADDAIEIQSLSGTTYTTLWTDHDESESGVTHWYHSKKVCEVPYGSTIKILLWDTSLDYITWLGKVQYKLI